MTLKHMILEAMADCEDPASADAKRIAAIVNARLGQQNQRENCNPQAVYAIRAAMRKKLPEFTQETLREHLTLCSQKWIFSRMGVPAKKPVGVDIETIRMGKEFLKAAGGVETAKALLDALG
jgi:hypothetical protein